MKKITIYTGPLCNYCDAAKRLLTRNNATYNEIDIGKVDGAMDEMIKKANGKRTIPQIFFNFTRYFFSRIFKFFSMLNAFLIYSLSP